MGLRTVGVRHFCWLRPNEEVTPHLGTWPNGAFAYFYDDPKFDCVFRLARVLPASITKQMSAENVLKPNAKSLPAKASRGGWSVARGTCGGKKAQRFKPTHEAFHEL